MIICFFRMADCNYTQNYSHHVCNHVGVRRLGSGKLGVIWSQSPIYRSKCIARNPRLFKWNSPDRKIHKPEIRGRDLFAHLQPPTTVPGRCPTWIPQSLGSSWLSWLSPTIQDAFSRHISQTKQSTPPKKTTKKLNPEWKETTNEKTNKMARSSDTPFIHLAIWRYLWNVFLRLRGKNHLKVPIKMMGKVPLSRHPWWKLQEVCQGQPKGFRTLPEIHPNRTIIDLTGGKSHSLTVSLLFWIWAWSLNSCFA